MNGLIMFLVNAMKTLPSRLVEVGHSFASKTKTLPSGVALAIVGKASEEEQKPQKKLGSRIATLIAKFSQTDTKPSKPQVDAAGLEGAVTKTRLNFEWMSDEGQKALANAGSWGIEESETEQERRARKEEPSSGNVVQKLLCTLIASQKCFTAGSKEELTKVAEALEKQEKRQRHKEEKERRFFRLEAGRVVLRLQYEIDALEENSEVSALRDDIQEAESVLNELRIEEDCRELEQIAEETSVSEESLDYKNSLSYPEIKEMRCLVGEEEPEFPEDKSEIVCIDPRTYKLMQKMQPYKLMQKMQQARREHEEQQAQAEENARRMREAGKSKPNEGVQNREELRKLVRAMKGDDAVSQAPEDKPESQKWRPIPGGGGPLARRKLRRKAAAQLHAQGN